MAKDRAHDPKRVPSLGISEPKSHVRTQPQSERREMSDTETDLGMKVDSKGNPDMWRRNDARAQDSHVKFWNNESRKEGTVPVVKIRSDK